MDGWQAFKIAIGVLGSVVGILLAVLGWFATKLSDRVDACMTHDDLAKLFAQQAEAEALRTQIQQNQHAQNAKALEQFAEVTRDSLERLEKKIDAADDSRQKLSNTVQNISLALARLTPYEAQQPPRFNHTR